MEDIYQLPFKVAALVFSVGKCLSALFNSAFFSPAVSF